MKVIDVDKLKKRFPDYDIGGKPAVFTGYTVKQIIDGTPTLEAVPMDFHERCLEWEIQRRISLEKRMPRWISAKSKDKTPQIGSVCLVHYLYKKGIIQGMTYLGDGWWDASEFITNSVDYWMPLPEPPKEDEDDEEE